MSSETAITVRYWAAARAATGVPKEVFEVPGALTLAELAELVKQRHGGAQVERVVAVCSVLLDEQPVASREPGQVLVEPGRVVDFLPPFAGG